VSKRQANYSCGQTTIADSRRDGDQHNDAVVEMKDVVVGYGDNAVIRIERLACKAGEVLVVVGRSGAGKTTLLNTLNGMIVPMSGVIQYRTDGTWVSKAPLTRIGRTFQSFPVLPWLKVREQFEVRSRIVQHQIDARCALTAMKAEHLAERFPWSLSGGERARCAIALALSGETELLFLDEPFNGLDFSIREGIVGEVRAATKTRHIASVIVTHDLYDACQVADEVAILGGRPTTLASVLRRGSGGQLNVDDILAELRACDR